ncbi:hypothetical protein AB0M22_15620 [Nocardia sp. NPDC051756]|uniref:hypothetical protein n=1 Tax=Nocardia sp. NPDC051756 TaxID=3154751 RepID=UPI00343C41F4
MPDFSADLNRIVKSASAWDSASNDLKQGSAKAQAIRESNKDVVWALFQETWDASVKAAQYVYDRLNEGSREMGEMGDALEHVAKVLMEQDQNFANVLFTLDAE